MTELMKRIDLPENTQKIAIAIYQKICSDKDIKAGFDTAITEYLDKAAAFSTESFSKELASRLDEHYYTVHMVFILGCALALKPKYDKKGISEEVYHDTMKDITWKIGECEKLHGITGIASFGWYHNIVSMTTFKLGRLEFAKGTYAWEDYKSYVKKGDTVYACHIPSAGPLTPDSVTDSLRRAYSFFGCEKYLIVTCSTWMLATSVYNEVFPENSNLRQFYECFDIIDEKEDPNDSNLWRVFYKPVGTPVDELPQDTTLQKNFVRFFKEGKHMNNGRGIIVFDGERIINK